MTNTEASARTFPVYALKPGDLTRFGYLSDVYPALRGGVVLVLVNGREVPCDEDALVQVFN